MSEGSLPTPSSDATSEQGIRVAPADKRQRAEAIDCYEVSLRQANKHAAHDAMLKLLCEWARETVASSAGVAFEMDGDLKVPLALPADIKKRIAVVMKEELDKNWQSDEDVIASFSRIAALTYAVAFTAALRTLPSSGEPINDPDRAAFLAEAQEQLAKVLGKGDIEAVRWMAQTAIDYHDSQAAGADAIGEEFFTGSVKYHEDRAKQLKALLDSTPSSARGETNQPAQPVVQCLPALPGQKVLTVLMLKDDGDKQADAAIEAVKKGTSTFLLQDPGELFFHQLRLRVAQDQTLADKISVYYLMPDTREWEAVPFATKEDELRWPVGFLHDCWEKETRIMEARNASVGPRATDGNRG